MGMSFPYGIIEGNRIASYKGKRRLHKLDFVPNGEKILIRSKGNQAKIWDYSNGKIISVQKAKRLADSTEIKFSSDGQYFGSKTPQRIDIWNISGKYVSRITRDNNKTRIKGKNKKKNDFDWFLFSHDNRSLVTYETDQRITTWDISGKHIASLQGHNGRIYDYQISFNNQLIATAGSDEEIKLWNLNNLQPSSADSNFLNAEVSSSITLDFDNESMRLLSTNSDYRDDRVTSQLWDLKGKEIAKFEEGSRSVQSLDVSFFNKDNYMAVTGSLQKDKQHDRIRLWDKQGKQIDSFNGEQGPISQAVVSTKNQILTISEGRGVILEASDNQGQLTSQRFNVASKSTDELRLQLMKLIQLTLTTIGLIVSGIYPIGYLASTKIANRKNGNLTTKSTSELEDTDNQHISKENKIFQELDDEILIAKAIRSNTSSFGEYFPLTQRQMKQSWRYLRKLVRDGAPVELDLKATLDQVGRQGFLLNPVLVPRRVNRTELMLLIDQDGSMTPFHLLSQRLVDTALKGGRLAKAEAYYFHNCPSDYLYRDPYHQDAVTIQDWLLSIKPSRTCILVVSDAGAARGGLSSERYIRTQNFIKLMRQRGRYIAWLNPMPKSRWADTTAGEIARIIPMLEGNRRGVQTAISVLQGKPYYHEH